MEMSRETNPPVRKSPIASRTSGSVSAAENQKRRFMSRSSWLSSSSGESAFGSSAIPQMGQVPGASRTISGCIGQVYAPTLGVAAGGASGCPAGRYLDGSLAKRSRQRALQNTTSVPFNA